MGSITKGQIGKEDCYVEDGVQVSSFTRVSSDGATLTLTGFPDIWKHNSTIINAKYYNAGTFDGATIAAAQTANTTSIIYLEPGTWYINDDLTTTAGVFLMPDPLARLTVASGKTLTIHSPENLLASPRQQVFAGAGTVTFTEGGTLHPDWWPIGTDADAAFLAVITAAKATTPTSQIVLTREYPTLTSALLLDPAVGEYLEIVGRGRAKLTFDSCSGLRTENTVKLRNFRIVLTGTYANTVGIHFAYGNTTARYTVCDKITIDGFDYGIKWTNGIGPTINDSWVDGQTNAVFIGQEAGDTWNNIFRMNGCRVYSDPTNGESAIRISHGNDIVFDNCILEQTLTLGVNLDTDYPEVTPGHTAAYITQGGTAAPSVTFQRCWLEQGIYFIEATDKRASVNFIENHVSERTTVIAAKCPGVYIKGRDGETIGNLAQNIYHTTTCDADVTIDESQYSVYDADHNSMINYVKATIATSAVDTHKRVRTFHHRVEGLNVDTIRAYEDIAFWVEMPIRKVTTHNVVTLYVQPYYKTESGGTWTSAQDTGCNTNTARYFLDPDQSSTDWQWICGKMKLSTSPTIVPADAVLDYLEIVVALEAYATAVTVAVDLDIGQMNIQAINVKQGNRTFEKALCAQVSWNPGNLVAGAGETSGSITVEGAEFGDFVLVAAPYDLQDCIVTGYVQAADTVEIRLQNEHAADARDFASGIWQVKVLKQ